MKDLKLNPAGSLTVPRLHVASNKETNETAIFHTNDAGHIAMIAKIDSDTVKDHACRVALAVAMVEGVAMFERAGLISLDDEKNRPAPVASRFM